VCNGDDDGQISHAQIMTKHPNDPWFPVIAMLVLALWVGVAGPILDDLNARGIYGFVKDWQTLFTAGIAAVAIRITWHNVTRQLRMQAKIREEDRMEAALPGLREAQDLLVPLLSDLRSLRGMQNANQIVRACFNAPEESFASLARRKLPNADERTQREVADMMLLLRVTSQQLSAAYSNHQMALSELRDKANFQPSDHDKLRDLEVETREAIVLHTRSMEAAISSLERLVMTYNKRTVRYMELLTKFRREIEAFWDRD
jgi:hypothetical protein